MSSPVIVRQSRDYVALMQCSAGDAWLPNGASQVSAWLRNKKNIDVDLSEWADHDFGSGVRLTVRPMPLDHGSDLWIRLVEDRGPNDRWTTEVLLHDERGDRDWVQLTVRNDGGRFVAVPGLASYLMQALPLGDSRIEFSDSPQTFGEGDVDRLVELLEDEGRHGLVFVAGTSHETIPFGAFAGKVGDWAKQVYGLAQAIVLDPAATAAFEARVGKAFAVPPWTIRTFQPGVRFDQRLDARRHRILGTSRLAMQNDKAIAQLLGDIARAQSATRPMDPSVLRVRRRLLRLENSRLVEAVSSLEVAPPMPEPEVLTTASSDLPVVTPTADSQVALVRSILRIKEITEESLSALAQRLFRRDHDSRAVEALRDRLDGLQTAMEEAEDEKRLLAEALDDAQLEVEVARLDVDDREARIRWLESRLKAKGDHEASYLDVPEEFRSSRPSSFTELLERINECSNVEFTGDADEVEKLNQVDTNDSALRTAWDAVLAMQDYAKARSEGACDKGLSHYLAHTPTGYATIAPGKFAENETKSTMDAHGDERLFAVPTRVDAGGYAVMKAHFKLAQIGMTSPRMHILDGHPDEPTIFIGYIGPHLTNTKTN